MNLYSLVRVVLFFMLSIYIYSDDSVAQSADNNTIIEGVKYGDMLFSQGKGEYIYEVNYHSKADSFLYNSRINTGLYYTINGEFMFKNDLVHLKEVRNTVYEDKEVRRETMESYDGEFYYYYIEPFAKVVKLKIF